MLLGHRNKAIRLDQAGERVRPTRQHFESDDLAGPQIHLRFEEGDELAMLKTVADALLYLAVDDERSLHPLIEPDRTRGACGLGSVECNVGPAEEVRNLALFGIGSGDAQESADLDQPALDLERARNRPQ